MCEASLFQHGNLKALCSRSEGARTAAYISCEALRQVAVAGEAGFERDGGDVLARVQQQALRMADTLLDDVLPRRAARVHQA